MDLEKQVKTQLTSYDVQKFISAIKEATETENLQPINMEIRDFAFIALARHKRMTLDTYHELKSFIRAIHNLNKFSGEKLTDGMILEQILKAQ